MDNDVIWKSSTLVIPAAVPLAGIASASGAVVLRGRDAVQAMQRVLVELCGRTGQAGAMDWLDYFLTSPDSLEKTPYLVLVSRQPGGLPDTDQVTADDLQGAVLLYEYRFAGLGTGVFATDDGGGMRTVIAPLPLRMAVAEAAIATLLRAGAVTVLVSLSGGCADEERTRMGAQRPRLGVRTRMVPLHLPLAQDYRATLALLGSSTRRNFRRYRHRAELDLGAEFIAEVRMGRAEFLESNRLSTNPASDAVTEWRYSLIERAGAGLMFCGVRAADGRWLSLIGGRRYSDTTGIDWQMNLAGFPAYSLSTVMRAFLLEHEIALGTTKLVFEGGTPHPMRHSFVSAETTDVLRMRPRSLRAWLLRTFARRIFPEKNFLRAALQDPTMHSR